jgi:hypothetical protein
MEEYTQLIVINVSVEHAHKNEIHKKVKECEKDRTTRHVREKRREERKKKSYKMKMHVNESSRFFFCYKSSRG